MKPTRVQSALAAAVLSLATLLSAAAPLAHASLRQTLVLFRDTRSTTIFGATPDDRANRILYPTVAMTKKTAEFLSELKSGQVVQCEFEALLQDYGKSTREVVWTIYSVVLPSCRTP